ncbi:MAG TPA: ATP-grasp domain-containing protein [Baekduia sp.]|uniref:ATP-grasp domain-containing protein n=1 Tax=Baekduia sp. TaxID=2600305 RepID=UPI002D792C86|nr:ATP-grasp domain-containing protein [Baekduia sp.]HET6507534.1 ATP-grasp domain-containing protein [Baekduia sp.]
MDVKAAADGVCDLVWIVDHDLGETSSMVPLLRRLGDVVDVTGLGHDAAAARIAEARPDGILALHDQLLSWTAEVAQRLGLPGFSPETAAALSDKRAQRAALAAGGVPMPAVLPVPPRRDRESLSALLGAATFPAVMKPRRSDCSRNTVLVRSRAELVAALDDVARHAPADRDALQLEEYLGDRPGAATEGDDVADYVSVESVVVAGRPRHLAVTGRFPPAAPLRETGMFIPAAMPADERRAALDLATAALQALGVERGCLHTEVKMTPDGPRVIEVNGRIGGGVPEMLRDVAGVELLPMALRGALDVQEDVAPLPPTTGVGYLFFRQLPREHRRVVSIDGLDELRARPGVSQVVLNFGPGSEIDWRLGTDECVFTVEGVAADHEALLAMRRAVEHDVVVVGEAVQDAPRKASRAGEDDGDADDLDGRDALSAA